MITKAVLPVAGLGTRLLPVTKEQPKAMLPVFSRGVNGELCVKPLLQMIFEQLFIAGIREFCFIVGRDKQVIQNHFAGDSPFVRHLKERRKIDSADNLRALYKMISKSELHWIDQLNPSGFGDAVLKAESFVDNDDFLVHAGDTCIMTAHDWHLTKCLEREEGEDVTKVVKQVKDPERFGVIRSRMFGDKQSVLEAIEKPKKFVSNLAIMPMYSFGPSIFEALRSIGAGVGGEIQLTDGIQNLIQHGEQVNAVELPRSSVWVDVGTPESYWQAQELTHNLFTGRFNLLEPVTNDSMVELERAV